MKASKQRRRQYTFGWAFLRGNLACDPRESRWLPPPMDIRTCPSDMSHQCFASFLGRGRTFNGRKCINRGKGGCSWESGCYRKQRPTGTLTHWTKQTTEVVISHICFIRMRYLTGSAGPFPCCGQIDRSMTLPHL
ncbi:hypothetical protein EVAR_70269_1 [Eumeta japonica]|uniref:Uncharacterized protein n=1 Tax=Eumeta variegata TaxID=151549 RepID=A0A4C2A8L4_EUMVA|nr:hypothetical protein EVAR_70269_1 [Eumeta japonica]